MLMDSLKPATNFHQGSCYGHSDTSFLMWKTLWKKENDAEKVSGYTDVHLPTCLDAIQDVIIEQSEHSPAYPGRLVTSGKLITKWGVSAIIQMKCNACEYVSSKRKLFAKSPRGVRLPSLIVALLLASVTQILHQLVLRDCCPPWTRPALHHLLCKNNWIKLEMKSRN